ncbi:MAG: serine/threonine protein kinase, partial [Planctomycetes bacterium]|nr:serine/threonine protein kinase [Planctomycetota bacterium]
MPSDEDDPELDWLDLLAERLGQRYGLSFDPPPEPTTDLRSSFARRAKSPLRVEREIGRGGMGRILKVWDDELGRPMALKTLWADAPGSGPSGRLFEEAQILGQLDHPGVVPVYEFSSDGPEGAYFTMRKIRGRNLQAVLPQIRSRVEGWSLTRGIGVIVAVCDTMDYAHSRHVVHRDLKPANVMIGEFGEVYVVDWGLAKVLGARADEDAGRDGRAAVSTDRAELARSGSESSSLLTRDGELIGTPYFMSPEQANGDDLGPAADIYAVGTLLYCVLTGVPPYKSEGSATDHATVLRRLRASPPEPVESLDPRSPSELVAICEKAMARAPEERYASMRDMADDLRAYLDGRVVSAHRTGAWAELQKWILRNKTAAASIALLVSVAILGSLAFAQHESRVRERALHESYIANIPAAGEATEANELDEARRRLDRCAPEYRGFEYEVLEAALDTSVHTLATGLDEARDIAGMPDGRHAAVCGGSSNDKIRWIDVDTGDVLAAASPEGARGVERVHVHPSGEWVYWAGGRTIGRWSPRSGALETLVETFDGALDVAVGRDGTVIAA